jgi:MerR family transcriptional regulator, light-induced transcriptional regulator
MNSATGAQQTVALTPAALSEFLNSRDAAIEDVSKRFYAEHAEFLDSFGPRGMAATREDIGYTIDFLRPVLEFGFVKPFVDYLNWLSEVLASRGVDQVHVRSMLEWLGEYYRSAMSEGNGDKVHAALQICSAEMSTQPGSVVSQIEGNMPAPWPEFSEMFNILLAGDARKGRDLFQLLMDSGHSLFEIELHVIQPALYEVGRKWQQNEVTVAQEHLATATAMTLMAQAFTYADIKPPIGSKVVCACVEGNQHSVGLRIVADGFELSGWDVKYLGPNVPTTALIDEVQQGLPDLVCLSVSMPDHLPTVKQVISKLRESLGDKVPAIMLGGVAINSFSDAASMMGADHFATDAEKALAAIHK